MHEDGAGSRGNSGFAIGLKIFTIVTDFPIEDYHQ
jgi:hypothetical protein